MNEREREKEVERGGKIGSTINKVKDDWRSTKENGKEKEIVTEKEDELKEVEKAEKNDCPNEKENGTNWRNFLVSYRRNGISILKRFDLTKEELSQEKDFNMFS